MSKLDDALEQLAENDRIYKEAIPALDKTLRVLQNLDKRIDTLESEKLKILNELSEQFDLLMISSHKLRDGYMVTLDNRYKIEIDNLSDFLKWLKQNKTANEVLDFFDDAIKLSNLKRFCETEFNAQRLKGILNPKIDGVKFGDITFRKLKTGVKK